ncbi:hypothetical protein CBFG_04031 [Clostridiales bacterium 1_7_47FAA]|nr:hypothetical protein CBFG_04031 [Clostridiales bacterium 1_7_47FAA]
MVVNRVFHEKQEILRIRLFQLPYNTAERGNHESLIKEKGFYWKMLLIFYDGGRMWIWILDCRIDRRCKPMSE